MWINHQKHPQQRHQYASDSNNVHVQKLLAHDANCCADQNHAEFPKDETVPLLRSNFRAYYRRLSGSDIVASSASDCVVIRRLAPQERQNF